MMRLHEYIPIQMYDDGDEDGADDIEDGNEGDVVVRVKRGVVMRVVARSTRDLLEGCGLEVDRGLEFPRSRLHLEDTLGEVPQPDYHNLLLKPIFWEHPLWRFPIRLNILLGVKIVITRLLKQLCRSSSPPGDPLTTRGSLAGWWVVGPSTSLQIRDTPGT